MTFSKQDLIDANIPMDLTIESIYQEYKNGRLSTLPRASMSSTLRNKYPAIKTLGDLFEMSPNTVPFTEFKQGVLTKGAELRTIYEARNKVTVIPSNMSSAMSLEEGLRAFVPEYLRAKRESIKLNGKYQVSLEKYCKTVEMLFDERASDNSREHISKALGDRRQNVDDKINQIRMEFNDLFLKGATVDNIKVHEELVTKVQIFNNNFVTPSTDLVMKRLSGINSPRMLQLLAIITGCRVLESGDVTRDLGMGPVLRLNKGKVKKILKQEGIPISYDDFKILLNESFPDSKMKETIESFVRNNHEYEIITDPSGREMIAIKWEYLNNLSLEVLRILYDNNAWGPMNAMKVDNGDVQREWERRVKLAGKKKRKFTPIYNHWRFMASKNGYLMLKWTKSDTFVQGQQYIRSLVLNNSNWSWDDVLSQADKDGYTNIYDIKVLRAYYTDATQDQHVSKALGLAIKLLDASPQKTMSFPSLLAAINSNGVIIKSEQLRRWIRKNNQVFLGTKRTGDKSNSISLINKKAPLICSVIRGRNSKPVPAPIVVANNNVDASKLNWEDIRSHICLQVPEVQRFSILQGSADRMYDIMKSGQNQLPFDSVFYGWIPELTGFSTMPSWDKDKLRLSLFRSIDEYLNCAYRKKNGANSDLTQDIINSIPYSSYNTVGLKLKFEFLSQLGVLPDKYSTYSRESLEYLVKQAANDVRSARNSMLGHTNGPVILSDYEITKQLHDTLLVFLYIASKV